MRNPKSEALNGREHAEFILRRVAGIKFFDNALFRLRCFVVRQNRID